MPMLFKIFTTIVFIAELIIAFTIISKLVQLDRKIVSANAFLVEANPKIRDVAVLIKDLSAQVVELIPVYLDELRRIRNKIALAKLESLIALVLFWSINIKVFKKLRKSKIFKTAVKGLSVLNSMI